MRMFRTPLTLAAFAWLASGLLGMAMTTCDMLEHCPKYDPGWSGSYVVGRIASGPLSIASAYREGDCAGKRR